LNHDLEREEQGLAAVIRPWLLVGSGTGNIGTQLRTALAAGIRCYPVVMVSGLGTASLLPCQYATLSEFCQHKPPSHSPNPRSAFSFSFPFSFFDLEYKLPETSTSRLIVHCTILQMSNYCTDTLDTAETHKLLAPSLAGPLWRSVASEGPQRLDARPLLEPPSRPAEPSRQSSINASELFTASSSSEKNLSTRTKMRWASPFGLPSLL
jgi:hypothetical protein